MWVIGELSVLSLTGKVIIGTIVAIIACLVAVYVASRDKGDDIIQGRVLCAVLGCVMVTICVLVMCTYSLTYSYDNITSVDEVQSETGKLSYTVHYGDEEVVSVDYEYYDSAAGTVEKSYNVFGDCIMINLGNS